MATSRASTGPRRQSPRGGGRQGGGVARSRGRHSRSARGAPTIDAVFDPRHNNLNFLRLAFCLVVIAVHGWATGGFGSVDVGHEPGGVAVDGFFVISGFLITASRIRARSGGRYIWYRCLRILPGYWVCLVVIAAVIAPIAWLHNGGTLSGYLRADPHGPFDYVWQNLALHPRFYDIAGTPADVPYSSDGGWPVSWNGSLWSLSWEFVLYLGVAVLGMLGIVQRRRRLVLVAAVVAWLARCVQSLGLDATVPLLGSPTGHVALRLLPLFLFGSVLYLYRDRIRLSTPVAAACAVVVVVGAILVTWPEALIGPPLAYLCIWLAVHLPCQRIGARRDLSYGAYIYGFPVQQLAAVYGVHHHGLVVYFVVTVAGTFACAAASWFLVERPAMRLKNWTPRRWARDAAGQPAEVAIPAPRSPASDTAAGDAGQPAGARGAVDSSRV
ncbi:acyltransferase [Frankia sp. CNm7]|uniref:Acyltransferase n=1 Tax=Frankia nepalensis TaxID=1836974 RepID=A0A937RGI5_9ACTN|nr:acyltransferase [Frankia nepalensis]MBL7499393.1 acyltransferase [Frankia nepalensis]MBL7509934.1 acyltransferase [Frankia nepalensis]MBL7522700.1 acyltransferase [Frankia nepalensis]MBL7629782.1 acyltransferase [Frankia nepalensis]